MKTDLTNLAQLQLAALAAQGLTAEVAAAAADAIEELERGKQNRLTGSVGQVIGFDAKGNPVAQSGMASKAYVDGLVGDIEKALAAI